MPEISVIVPVYKVEPYLRRCVDSILAQTFTDFELILVDDGSPDGCPAICDEYALQDSRIRVIHKENGGLSSARNAGLDIATGKYIGFVDSDDYIHPQMYDILFNAIEDHQADIVICDVVKVDESSIINLGDVVPRFVAENSGIGLIETYYENYFEDKTCQACNKLYIKKLFEDLRYKEGFNFEDVILSFPLFYKAKKIMWINAPLYYYFQSPQSITRGNLNTYADFLIADDERRRFLKKIGMKQVEQKVIKEIGLQYIWVYGNIYLKNRCNVDFTKRFREVNNRLRHFLLDILFCKHLCKIQKIEIVCSIYDMKIGERLFWKFFY